MDTTPTRLVRLLVTAVVALLSATFSWSAELPFRQFYPGYDSHVLSSASIQKLLQDRSGYIWIGFYSSGLSRYNGNHTIIYGLADGLADLTVREIVEDEKGHLWVGSDTGIVVSDRPLDEYDRGERVRFVSSIGETSIIQTRVRRNTIHCAPDGRVWVATPGAGLLSYEWVGNSLRETRVSTDLDGDGVNEAVHSVDSLGGGERIIASAGRGRTLVVSASSGGWSASVIESGPSRPINAWHSDSSDKIWAGGVDGTIWHTSSIDEPFVQIETPLAGARIMDFIETPSADIWASSLGTGLVRISRHDVSEIQHFTRENGLISETIWSILLDHEGNLWFAQNGGISRLMSDFEAFTNYRSSLPDRSCFASLPPSSHDADRRLLWVGTGSGLAAIMNDERVDVLSVEDGLLHNSVYALERDEQSRLWVGTVDGFSVLDFDSSTIPTGGVSVERSVTIHGKSAMLRSYPFQIVYSVREMSVPGSDPSRDEKLIWIAGQSGIRVIGDGLSLAFRQSSGLPGTGAIDVLMAPDGHLWVATSDRGLFRSRMPVTAERLRSFPTVPDRAFGQELDESIFDVLWDTESGAPTNGMRNLLRVGSQIWVGTANGLAVFEHDESTPKAVLDKETGLGGQTIVGIAYDPASESVWVSQNAGIARVDLLSLQVTRIVTVGDGLLDNEAWAYHSIRLGPDGAVYLSTPEGLSVYKPWRDSPTLSEPLLKIDRADVNQGIFGHRESVFEFAPLTYVNENDVVYRTRLLGFDEGWSSPTSEARIRYTNLPAFGLPRLYTFEVMAKSGDGVWTEPTRFEFHAVPPWWSRWWSLLLWIALFVVVVVVYNRFRTVSLARQNARLEAIVNERTAEIAAQAMEIDTLDRIVQIINREVEFEKVLQALLEQGMVLFPESERGGSLIYDHERGKMNIPAAIGYDAEVLSRIRMSAADARKRYEAGGTEIDEGIYLLRSLGDLAGVTDVTGVPAPLSMLAMAITIDDRVEAFLVFENFSRINAFEHVNLRTARRYREHARTAVAKALILRELEMRNRETQRANEAKSTFLANMSHELRTPLNSIIGFSELLVEKLGDEIDDRHRHFLRLILSSGQHLLSIINDILDLSKVEAGKMQIFPEVFDPRLAIEGVQQVMRPVAAKKNVTVEVHIEETLPEIETDPGKFKQILYNLVSNAVKFSESNTTVRIQGRHLPSEGMIRVAVEDEGIGIAPDQLETIFDEFKQVESSMSRRYEGTGLGLSLVRRFVEFLGGEIEVESELDVGSTFTFKVPVELPERLRKPEADTDRAEPSEEESRGRILVVEDDDQAWEFIRSALTDANLGAVRASTGEEAIRLARTVHPTAVTLDIGLPGEMSGWDVLKQLKANSETEDLPVIIVSHSKDHELGIALGADDYLVKPVEAEQLNDRLKELVEDRLDHRVRRLLLIDDDKVVHQILGGFLRDAGYEVISALTGRDGIRKAIDASPDAIILDLILPDLSGFQVAETLRQLGETNSIPVIVLTSKDLNTTEQSSLESHLEKIVRKGTGTRPALLDAIDRVLPKKQPRTGVS